MTEDYKKGKKEFAFSGHGLAKALSQQPDFEVDVSTYTYDEFPDYEDIVIVVPFATWESAEQLLSALRAGMRP